MASEVSTTEPQPPKSEPQSLESETWKLNESLYLRRVHLAKQICQMLTGRDWPIPSGWVPVYAEVLEDEPTTVFVDLSDDVTFFVEINDA